MPAWLSSLDPKDWVIVFATLAGPILAVQAQKWVERWGERQKTRRWLFGTLMATRGARASYDHVRALNSIELTFYGKSKTDREVIAAWREYYRQLNTMLPAGNDAAVQLAAMDAKRDELFLNLLELVGSATGYALTRDEIRSGSYAPIAHGQIEQELTTMRQLALEVLDGRRHLGMDVRSYVQIDPQ